MDFNLKSLTTTPSRLVSPESWVKHLPFAFFCVQVLKPKVIVELGVHTGNSFCGFAEASNLFQTNTKVYGVDTFEGEIHAGFYDDHVYNELSAYIKENFNENISLMKMRFEEAVTYFSNESIDILHIDGLHTYEAAKSDYDLWLKKVKKNGVILFHDTIVRRDEFGVWKLWEEIKDSHHYSYEFLFGHGLGVIALGDNELVRELTKISSAMGIDKFFLPAGERNEWLYQYRKMSTIAKEEKSKFEYIRDVELTNLRNNLAEHKSILDEYQCRLAEHQAEHQTRLAEHQTRLDEHKSILDRFIGKYWFKVISFLFNSLERVIRKIYRTFKRR